MEHDLEMAEIRKAKETKRLEKEKILEKKRDERLKKKIATAEKKAAARKAEKAQVAQIVRGIHGPEAERVLVNVVALVDTEEERAALWKARDALKEPLPSANLRSTRSPSPTASFPNASPTLPNSATPAAKIPCAHSQPASKDSSPTSNPTKSWPLPQGHNVPIEP